MSGSQKSCRGCLIFGGLALAVLLALVAGGAWWYWSQQPRFEDIQPESRVFVVLLTPASGDDATVGDVIQVTAHLVAPEPIASATLFVDGQAMNADTVFPDYASWTWRAMAAGAHTLVAHASTTSGEEGKSQVVIVNVLPAEGQITVAAEDGKTLEKVGAAYGVPPEQMADANPHIDPAQPLPGGFAVQVPVGGGNGGGQAPGGGGNSGGQQSDGGGNVGGQPSGGENAGGTGAGSGSGAGGGGLTITRINWQFVPQEPVDRSYCYVSAGDGKWERIPKTPFDFLNGTQTDYLLDVHIPAQGTLFADCWGWLGGVLKFLGEGQSGYDLQQNSKMFIVTNGFQLTAAPQFNIPPENFTSGKTGVIPAPFAVREALNTEDCTAHFGNPFVGFVCDALFKVPVKQNLVLVWEWEPRLNWPGYDSWFNDIDGYRLYEIDPLTKEEKFLKEIRHPGQKAAVVPLPWGTCYGVRAFSDNPAIEPSEMATYCPSSPPTPAVMTLKPTDWLTSGGLWLQDGDCDTYGSGELTEMYDPKVLVGSYIVDDDDNDCFRQGDYSGAVKFDMPMAQGWAIQRAVLKFSSLSTEYHESGVATNLKPLCAAELGEAVQDWSALGGGDHVVNPNVIWNSYYSPFVSLSGADLTPEVDVTLLVRSWLEHPDSNHGFILNPRYVHHHGECETWIGNFELEIYYFPQP